MTFDYEYSVWGRGTATLAPSDPTSIRLREALKAIAPLKNGDLVLEVGCGAGQFIRAIKTQRPELICHGTDISQIAIEIARQNSDAVQYSVQDNDRLPYSEGLFSAVVIFDVLEHVSNPAAFLIEVNRVLKTDGILYLFVPCEADALSLWHGLKFFGIGADLTRKFAGHIQYFTRRSLFDLIKTNGFEIERVRYSEHVLGQLLGIAAFFSMSAASKNSAGRQLNNETYFTENLQNGRWSWFRKFVNSLIYMESTALGRLPSPNVHLVAKKT